jgi:hypothetical protein
VAVTWRDGVTLTAEIAMSTASGGYGVWDLGRWDEFAWGPGVEWQDLSSRLRGLSTERRFSRELNIWQAGRAVISLDNRDGDLSPDNIDGTYVISGTSQIRPSRPCRLRATYGGITHGLIRSTVTDWREHRTQGADGRSDSWVSVASEDAWSDLAGIDGVEQDPVGAGELSGARVARILAAAEYRGGLALDAGVVTLQASTLGRGPIADLKTTVDSEGGACWIDADGVLVFHDRNAIIESSRSNTVQHVFGDGGGSEIPYQALDAEYDRSLICNDARFKRVGGTVQVASDATSRSVYGLRRDVQSDLICETDTQARSLALWKVARYADPEKRFTRMVLKPRTNPTVMFPVVLGLRERDLVRVTSRPAGGYEVTRDCHVAGISHAVTADDWTTTVDLWSASAYDSFWTSRWGVGRWDEFRWF